MALPADQHRGPMAYAGASVALALAVVLTALAVTSGRAPSARDFTFMALGAATIGTVALGLAPVLLMGEIDLSVGAVGGAAVAAMTVLSQRPGVPDGVAIAVAVAGSVAAGVAYGLLRAWRMPSMVVTLAGLFVWDGLASYLVSGMGVIGLDRSDLVVRLADTWLPAWLSWSLLSGAAAAWATAREIERRRLRDAGRSAPIWRRAIADLALFTSVAAAVTALNADRGVPLLVVIFFGLVLGVGVMLRYTAFGESLVAAGRDRNDVRGAPRLVAFGLCSGLAGIGGMMLAGRFGVVAPSGTLSAAVALMAFTSAVCGGVSIYGGRGGAMAVLLGIVLVEFRPRAVDPERALRPTPTRAGGVVRSRRHHRRHRTATVRSGCASAPVEPRGLEPLTPALQRRCSAS